MGIEDKVTRRSALLGATGLLAASGLETSVSSLLISPAFGQNTKPKMATEIPPEITTPVPFTPPKSHTHIPRPIDAINTIHRIVALS